MNTTNSVLILVNSLTKAEKRYFNLYSNLQSGEKAYIVLYKLITPNTSAEELFNKFCASQPGKSFDMAAKHLYRNLSDCLVRLREKQNIQSKIFNQISKSGIFFEREMFEEAFTELEKAKTLAKVHEEDALSLLIRRTELKYLNALDFRGISEKKLVNKQMKINEITKYSRTLNQHLQLYEILKHRLIYKGYSRSDKQKENLNDLILSELHLISNTSYKGFEPAKLHLLFQATYYLNSGNYTSAIRHYQEIIRLFEENSHLIQNPPIYYLGAIQGVLDSLQIAGLYKAMPFFISKLKAIEKNNYSTEFLLQVKALVYLYEQNSFLQTGNIISAKKNREESEEVLLSKIPLLNLEVQLKLHLNSAILDMYIGEIKLARKSMRKIFSSGKQYYSLPSYKTARLINLLLQIELKDLDFIENEIISIKRNIGFDKQIYITEKLIFKFVRDYPLSTYKKARTKLWEKYRNDIKKIEQDKYELRLLRLFDVVSWIEHKLTEHPLSYILSKKNTK